MTVNVYFIILSISWINLIGDPASAEQWPGLLDEVLDEVHDAEIYKAVVDSMRQWELHKKHSHRAKREASRVCYEDVGCFEDTGPFSYLEMLPSPPKDVGTRFFVYGSRKARSVPMEVPADDINEKAHNAIDPELPTKVIVHGFGSGCDHIWVYEMRSALMSVHDCNIVCVDWSPGSVLPNYVRAAANTRLVGRQLAKLIRGLNVPLDKVHFIGFSLGAHVAGFAGAELGNVSRITGLDPAGPLFESQDPRARLDETDANFVDVIHSNGEQLLLGGLGSWQPMGDVDFYPNGGRMQTGCSNLFVGAVSDIIWTGTIEGRSLCNHRRAYKLFTDSVSPKCRFPAFPCEKGYDGLLQGDCFPCGDNRPCGDMGYYADTAHARGQMYLITREEEPFCAHQYQIKLYNSRSERPTRSYGKLQVTLVGAGGFNETFTMTRKDDEELVVGAVLHKIVVPHPVVIDLEAIEVKYTAYSGWISSGLVTWGIDKVSIFDSYGKSLSVCRRGLMLESGHPVHLPLYPGECNIPQDFDASNSTSNSTNPEPIRNSRNSESTDQRSSGIGPFTKDQNFDLEDTYDFAPQPSKNIGPFTKEQNIRYYDEKPEDDAKQTIWTFVDLNETGNSLDNSESESGRGFSNPAYVPSVKSSNAVQNRLDSSKTSQAHPEIREPVLQVKKKETGRSMRLPEIKEPLLRPRTTHQDEPADKKDDRQESENQDDSRGFTVQFLPERLAGILAQAERYARQTLLPLISQYTPSFIGNTRKERVKYFPPLSEIAKNENKAQHIAKDDVAINEKDEDWVPIAYVGPQIQHNQSTYRTSDNSEGRWISREGKQLIANDETPTNSQDPPKKIDDWVPITEKSTDNLISSPTSVEKNTAETFTEDTSRKFIPLVDLTEKSDDVTSPTVTTTEIATGDGKRGGFRNLEARSLAFPYAYERKTDPRTRYIPLVPEEDLGRQESIFQKEE